MLRAAERRLWARSRGVLRALLGRYLQADPATLRAHARARGWDRLRLLSCAENTLKVDLGSEDEAGHQDSTISVFTLDPDGTPRHFYTAHPHLSDDIKQRGIDLLTPAWHLLDLTPQGASGTPGSITEVSPGGDARESASDGARPP